MLNLSPAKSFCNVVSARSRTDDAYRLCFADESELAAVRRLGQWIRHADQRPAVSVLMTAYNAERFVGEAIDSILQQTFRDFELVIVDDASTDGTLEVLIKASEADDRVRVLGLPENKGISGAANMGLAHCAAPLIARIDADDLAKPNRLAKQVEFMGDNDQVVCVGTFIDFMDEQGRRLKTIKAPPENAAIQSTLLEGHCTLWHTSSMMRADAVRSVGGYNLDYSIAVDIELWLRLGEVGQLANLPEVLQSYRFYDTSVSGKRREKQMDLCERAVRQASKRRGIPSRFRRKEHWRPGADAASQLEFTLRHGWWAYRSGELATARLYALRALNLYPLSREAWCLLRDGLLPTWALRHKVA